MEEFNLPTQIDSKNFYTNDDFLINYVEQVLDPVLLKKYTPFLKEIGQAAAQSTDDALKADQNPPELKKFNIAGVLQNKIEYHSSYENLRRSSYGRGLISIKYDEKKLNSKEDKAYRQFIGFLAGFVFSKTDTGVFCPICMTDSLAWVLEKYLKANSSNSLAAESLKGLTSSDMNQLFEGAMFLTERQGGSDVGKNEVEAYQEEGRWKIKGHKWFCSNADAEVALVLARMPQGASGTKGLGLFLFRRTVPKNNITSFETLRLKDKLGVRSMASGEIQFNGTEVTLLAGENQGFKMMAEMVNMSRIYNSVASLGVASRAIDMAKTWGMKRKAFDLKLEDQPLWRLQLAELESEFQGLFLLTFECIKYLDLSENGDNEAKSMVRLLTPIIKALCGKFGVFAASEAIELIGGNAYIEEYQVAKLLRDVQVLPIWEGTTNIQSLDVLRVFKKEPDVLQNIERFIETTSKSDESVMNLWTQAKKKIFAMSKMQAAESSMLSRQLLNDLGRILVRCCMNKYEKSLSLEKAHSLIRKRSDSTDFLGKSVEVEL